MPRSLSAAALAAAALFAACASSPPPLPPLALGERFDVVYDGRVGVLPPMDPAVVEATSALAALNGSTADTMAAATEDAGTGTAAVRLWLIELPADDPDARALADGAAVKAARPIHARGAHITPQALAARIEAWHDRANVVSAPFLATKLDEPAMLRISQQRAAVSGLRVQSQAGVLAVDPQVDTFEHGTRIEVRVQRNGDGDGVTAAIAWSMVDMNEPRTVAAVDGGAFGSLEVPIALQQSTKAEVKLAAHGALLLGPVPTTDRRFVQALAVEIDAR
ncbi:MAG: hypothetical protein FJ306_05120 [Planctomycetes bacterium]|nr:hypothetical protein [Planctomycetota bacterium]